jgi:NAD(P)-dependent dehydrogenase (short-subunit alcohol dehydrogenase family)
MEVSPTMGCSTDLRKRLTVAGGVGIAVPYDHADDHRVRALFERIESEQGHLDILVNNATINITASDVSFRPPFWARNLGQADEITLGLRLAYLSSYYAAPLLLGSEKALVANLSSYEYDDAAYGATKAGLDRMTWHMAQHFKVYGFKGTGI